MSEGGGGITRHETLSPSDPRSGYSEAQYGNRSIAWLRKAAADPRARPFFLYLGTTGPHLGAIPAPWHRDYTARLNVSAPRTPNFNHHAADHHPLLATAPALDERAMRYVDQLMADRYGQPSPNTRLLAT